jgi:hypothetical protein
MDSVLSLRRSEYSVVWLPIEPSVDATMPPADDPKSDSLYRKKAPPGIRDPRAMPRLLVAFCIGVIATLAWQSCSDAARQLIETSSLQSGGLAPIAPTTPDVMATATFAAPSLDKQRLAAVWENVDQRAASQQQISLSGVQLASAQEQIAHDFDSLAQIKRHTISKMSVPLPRPAPAETRKHASRLATTTTGADPNAHHVVTSSTSFGPSSPSPAVSMRLDTGRKRTRFSAAALRSSAPEPFSQSLISASQRLMLALSKITGIHLPIGRVGA